MTELFNHQHIDNMDNSQWISNEEVKDPDPLPEVLGWRLLVRPVNPRPKTKGGIVLPDIVKSDMSLLNTVGRVLSIGPLAWDAEGMHMRVKDSNMKVFMPWAKVGDYVMYGKNMGRRLTYKGVKLIILEDRDILMKLDSPNYLDPSY